VLGFVPSGADPELDATVAHLVDLRHRDRERPRQPEGRRGHQGAQPDRRGVAGQAGQCQPGVGGPGQPLDIHGQVVVAAEEGVEPQLLGVACDTQQVVVRRSLLRLGENSQIHPHSLTSVPGRSEQSPRSSAAGWGHE
jgi:hypothetical protein